MTCQVSLTSAIVFVSALAVSVSLHAQQTQPADPNQAQATPAQPEGHPPLPQGHPTLPKGHPEITKQSSGPPVYETTEIEPAWRVAVRHLIIQPADEHLHVTEVWAVHNPTNQIYIGAPVESITPLADEAQPKDANHPDRITMVLPLPAGSMQVQPGPGFHTCCVRTEGNKIISKMPMKPGVTEFRVDYMLLAEDGVFNLSLTTPAPTDHMMIFLPDDGSQVTVQGLETGDPFETGDQRYRMYSAKQLDAGATTSLVIQSLVADRQATTDADTGASRSGTIKYITGGGVGLLALAGLFVLLRPTKKFRSVGAAA